MNNRVFITGYYGFGNVGDEAILAAMVSSLRALRPALQIVVTSAEPAATESSHEVQAILWSDAQALFESVRAADLVLIGGGGLFHDYRGFNPNAFLTDNHWGISFYAGPAVLGALFQKPVMLYSVGVGPLFSEHGKRFTKIAADCAELVTLRDKASEEILLGLGVDAAKLKVTADPALGLDPPAAHSHYLPARSASEPLIGIALRNWDFGVDPNFWEKELAAGLDQFLENNSGQLLFVPFQHLPALRDDDLAIARRIINALKHKGRATLIEVPLGQMEIREVVGGCDLVLGMRLHSLIFAISAGLPVLALSYDPKVEELMKSVRLDSHLIDLKAIDAAAVRERLLALVRDSSSIRQTLREQQHLLRERANSTAALAVDLLESRREFMKPLTLEVLGVVSRSLQTHLRESRELRMEGKRLFEEIDFYMHQSKTNEARANEFDRQREQIEADKLLLQLDFEAKIAAQQELIEVERAERRAADSALHQIQKECAALEGLLAAAEERARLDLDAHASALKAKEADLAAMAETPVRAREREMALLERILKAEELRDKTVRGIDRFQHQFNTTLQSYRDQKAWQIMLCIRKAYTLLVRNAPAGWPEFAAWVFRLPFSGAKLAAYDLPFPTSWNYVPEKLEVPLVTGLAGTGSESHSTGLLQSGPARIPDLFAADKYDVVILAIFDFEFRFQRPQQIAAQFARSGHRVFWVSPGRTLDEQSLKPVEVVPLRDNIWEVRLRGKRPELYTGELAPTDLGSYLMSLKSLYQDNGIVQSCAILQFPFWRQVGLGLREQFGARVIYDCMDDWQNWTMDPIISKFSLEEEKKLAREADVLVVTSQEFLERSQSAGLKPILVRNAADYEFFSAPRPQAVLPEAGHPIVGYYGAISDWFDLRLVEELAKARPQYSFVIIGGVHGVDTSALERVPNVRLLGERNYREIPRYLSQFDVCLIPFLLNKLTKGVDPVKMYEYFSQGKPVVATNMAELPAETGLLYIGADHEDFFSKVDLAVQERNPELCKQRMDFAAANSWEARVHVLDTVIRQAFPLVSILIVSYNCEEFLEACLDAVLWNTGWPHFEVIAVDNCSTDRSAAILNSYAALDTRLSVYVLDSNTGFAGGNNFAAEKAKGEYLVLLNADTIVPSGWLGRIVRHSERDSSLGGIAAVTNFSGNETKVNFDYSNVIEMQRFAHKRAMEFTGEIMDIGMAPLYCVLIPRRVWRQVGPLDEQYKVGMFEDDDFSLRIKRAGYRVVAAEDAFIHHFGNGSFAKIPNQESARIFEANRKRYESKWGVPWKPHKLRPGARPPYEDIRTPVRDFLSTARPSKPPDAIKPILRRLHPPFTPAGTGFNVQVDGTSALVVECQHATPGTVIVFGSQMLPTAYGSSTLLSATVGPDAFKQEGTISVRLVNDFGESNRIDFVCEANASATAHA